MSRLTTFPITLTALLLSVACVNAATPNPNQQVRQALDRVLPASLLVQFNGVPLRDTLDFVRDLSGANVHINWKAIEAVNISADAPVSIRLRNVTVRKVLSMILSEAAAGEQKLAYYVDGGVLEITSQDVADTKVITRVYPVQDLIIEPVDVASLGIMSPMMMGGGLGSYGYGGGMYGGGAYGAGRSGGRTSGMYGPGAYVPGGLGSGAYGPGGYPGQGAYGPPMGPGGFPGSMYPGGWNMNPQPSGSTQSGKKSSSQADDLIDLIKTTIYPSYWTDNKASIRFYNGNLVITAPRIIHEALAGPID